MAARIGLSGDAAKTAADIMLKLGRVFLDKDCSLAEINPLVQTKSGEMLAIDAKFNFDDNALFRHPDIEAMFDPSEENPAELRAKEFDLSYIALGGNIGCLVNGAGLAMATMDIIKFHGGQPANFLDVGGSVTPEGAVEAFRIILSDASVKAVLVNIFGGIAKCDVIADALIKAAKEVGFKIPVVVRLEGTNVEIARKMLKDAAIPQLRPAADLTDAAKQVCAAV
jgi:succinyl-CoA synthetase beta subunit